MQESIAQLVHPVFTYGLRAQGAAGPGRVADFETEQAAPQGPAPERGRGPPLRRLRRRRPTRRARAGAAAQQFLGIRYALVCWLDELFIARLALVGAGGTSGSSRSPSTAPTTGPGSSGSRRRPPRAGPAATRSRSFFLCVMLGFRGEVAEEPERLRGWVAAARTQLGRVKGQEWVAPPELVPPLVRAAARRPPEAPPDGRDGQSSCWPCWPPW